MYRFSTLFFCLILLLGLGFSTSVETKEYRVYEVTGDGEDLDGLVQAFRGYSDLVVFENNPDGNGKVAVVSSEALDKFEDYVAEYCSLTVIKKDLPASQGKEISATSSGFDWESFYDVDVINAWLEDLTLTYPDITELVVGGHTYEGRQILGIRINTSSGNTTSKPVAVIESGQHAREWIAPSSSTYFIDQLLKGETEELTSLKENFDWHIFPVSNPDGYHYTHTIDRFWRKNRSQSPNGCVGVDLNRNYGHEWGTSDISTDPCDYQIYAGTEAFSEIESKTFSEYIASLDNLKIYLNLHAHGQMLLIPYATSTNHTGNYDDLIKIGTTGLKYAAAVNNAIYDGPGTAAEILGASSGNIIDWVRETLDTPVVFTIELRGFSFQWPDSTISAIGEELTQMVLGMVTEATSLGYF